MLQIDEEECERSETLLTIYDLLLDASGANNATHVVIAVLLHFLRILVRRIVVFEEGVMKIVKHLYDLFFAPPIFALVIVDSEGVVAQDLL